MEDGKLQKKILIVDDIPINRQILRNIFKNLFVVIEAADGMDALNKLESNKDICMVIMDIMMPKLSGYGVLEKMNKDSRWKDIPVVIITVDDSEKGQIKAFDLGATDVISKPFSAKLVRRKVINILNRWKVE